MLAFIVLVLAGLAPAALIRFAVVRKQVLPGSALAYAILAFVGCIALLNWGGWLPQRTNATVAGMIVIGSHQLLRWRGKARGEAETAEEA